MDIKDINRTIEELEKDSTTFENCQKLASLYIVRQNYETGLNERGNRVKQELTDILPAYSKYVDTKRRFQLGELSEKVVEKHIKLLSQEIYEFLQALYINTDMPIERQYIKSALDKFYSIF